MIWIFKRTTALAVFGYVLMAGFFIAGLAFDIPFFPMMALMFLIPLGIEIGALFWSVKLFSIHMDTANTDAEGFLAKNQQLYRKVRGKLKPVILENEITMLISYRRIRDAESRLPELAQQIMPSDTANQFFYLTILMELDTLKRNYTHMDAYISEKRILLDRMGSSDNAYHAPYTTQNAMLFNNFFIGTCESTTFSNHKQISAPPSHYRLALSRDLDKK